MIEALDGLFDGLDAAQVAAIRRNVARERENAGRARAQKAKRRHEMRRATSEAHLATILPARFDAGDSWHVISHGDIDALTYVRHALQGVTHFDHVVMSTWCIARYDLEEVTGWIDTGRIDQFDLYAGEIFPSQYGDEYEQMLQMCEDYGCRLVIARNHSKVTLMRNDADRYSLVVESSANVNTNPRIEQAAIHADAALFDFYLEFFSGLKTIDKR